MSLSGDFKSHGLLGAMVEPDWPPLTLEEVDRVLRRYPQAQGAMQLLTRSPRPFSAAGVVKTRLGEVFVKRHARLVRDRKSLLEEHRFIAFLASARAQQSEEGVGGDRLVQAPLPDEDGETVVSEGDWSYEVHPVAKGVDLYQDALSWTPFFSAHHAYEAGRTMARLHIAAADYDEPRREATQLVSSFTIFSGEAGDPLLAMERYLEHRPLLKRYAEERDWRRAFAELLRPRFAELSPWLASMTPLWTHNDFHASNLMWSSDGEHAKVSSVIDFGLADKTNAVHDLAIAIERNMVEWLRMEDHLRINPLHLDHLDSLLLGYERISPLSYEEARGLVAMLPLVHCEFALSETDYFLSVLGSPERAYLAYELYFLAHAEWFRSAPGKQLIQHLERWAESAARKHAVEGRL